MGRPNGLGLPRAGWVRCLRWGCVQSDLADALDDDRGAVSLITLLVDARLDEHALPAGEGVR